MFEIITVILFIIFASILLTTFFKMRKTIKSYREENMHLRRILYEEENNKRKKIVRLECDKPDFKTYNATLELPLEEYRKYFNGEFEMVTKRQLAIEIAERIITDNNIFLEFEEDKLNNNVKITASIRVAIVNNE